MTIGVPGGGGGGGGTPSGPAGGDLTGTYPNPTLSGTANVQAIITGNVTVAGAIQSGSVAGGDLAGTYPNPTLAVIGSAAGPIGDGTHVAAVTIDAKGRVTALTAVAITGGGGSPSGPAGGDLTGTYPNPTLSGTANVESIITANTTVAGALQKTGGTMSGAIAMGANKVTNLANGTLASDAAAFGQIPTALPPNGAAGGDLAGTYPIPTLSVIGSATGPIGDGTHVSTVTIDAKGRVTALTSTAITGFVPLSTVTTAGDLIIATGSGAVTRLAAPASGLVLTGNGAGVAPTYQAPVAGALTNGGANLPSNLTILASGATLTIQTIPSLAIGTWIITVLVALNSAAANDILIQLAAGTATATFLGGQTARVGLPTTPFDGNVSFTTKVTVTVAGTLVIGGISESLVACTVRALDPQNSFPATGWTSLKVA